MYSSHLFTQLLIPSFLCSRRSLIVFWRWQKSHCESSSMPSWPAKTWTRPGRRPSTRSSANWTARSQRSLSPQTVSKSFYMSKFHLLLLFLLAYRFALSLFFWFHRISKLYYDLFFSLFFNFTFDFLFFFSCLFVFIFILFFLNVWKLWSSIPNLKPLVAVPKWPSYCVLVLILCWLLYVLFFYDSELKRLWSYWVFLFLFSWTVWTLCLACSVINTNGALHVWKEFPSSHLYC